MSLCRHYVRELRRSVLIDTPDNEKSGSKRSSVLENLGEVNDPTGPSMNLSVEEKSHDQRLSSFLRHDDPYNQSPQGSLHSQHANGERGSAERPPRASFMSTRDPRTDSTSPAHTVARPDIRASAEKILYTFLLPGSEREIVLPDSITSRITRSIEEEGRDDPEVFDAAKDYVFQAMERDAFPGFLRTKALGNLVPPSMMLRLILGLLSMFGGFWAAFVLIFLDYGRVDRLWVRRELLPESWCFHLLTSKLATSPNHDRRVRPGLPPVCSRPDHGSRRILGVHLHVVQSHSRAVRAAAAQQACSDRAVGDYSRRGSSRGALCLCAWQTSLSSAVAPKLGCLLAASHSTERIDG